MENQKRSAADTMDVAYVARLARLSLSDEERRAFQSQLDQVLEYVRKIRQLDLEGIEPTSHAVPVSNVMRDDGVRPGMDHDVVMANAPLAADGQFVVPKIVE